MGDRDRLPEGLAEGASKEGTRARLLYSAWISSWAPKSLAEETIAASAFAIWYTQLLARSWAAEEAATHR